MFDSDSEDEQIRSVPFVTRAGRVSIPRFNPLDQSNNIKMSNPSDQSGMASGGASNSNSIPAGTSYNLSPEQLNILVASLSGRTPDQNMQQRLTIMFTDTSLPKLKSNQ